jgi:hypothetical protein
MSFDFYLSEMSPSEGGGGLTLQRVLGPDVDAIDCYIDPVPFPKASPAPGGLGSRPLNRPAWQHSGFARRLVRGLAPNRLYHMQTLKRRIHGRGVASQIAKRFRGKKEVVRGLVCPAGFDSLYCVDAFSRFPEIEYVTWIMDDAFVRWDGDAWRYEKGVEGLLQRHLNRAKAVFTISPAMQAFFHSRFGVRSEVLFGPAEALASPVWQRPGRGETVRLGYFGALFPWQTDTLRLLAERLGSLNSVLDIYGGFESLPSCLNHPGVTFCGRIPPQQVRSVMQSYDAVVLPVSFEPQARNLSEFNIATKMSECLSSGTLTLAIAPPYAIMSKILQSEQAAVVVNETSSSALRDAIGRIRAETDRVKILRAAGRYVESALSSDAMRRVWLRGISQCWTPDSSTS